VEAIWAKKYELADTTIQTLQENGFDSLQSCGLLNTSMIQKHFAKLLTLGQTLLLQKAVDSLVPPESTPVDTNRATVAAGSKDTMPSAVPGNFTQGTPADGTPNQALDSTLQHHGLDAATLMNILGGPNPSPVQPDNGKTFDPFGCTSQNSGSKFYDIREFITVMPLERKEGGTLKVGDIELNLSESKPKLDSITPMQYMEAALRILREMAAKDGASLEQVLQYVGYLVKIANMGQRFQWKSVIKYDYEYRKAQADAGFAFGADSSFMMQLFLRDKMASDHSSHKPANATTHPQQKFDPRTGKPICGQFNSVKGCQLPHCKFAHVCRTCFGAHGFPKHKDLAPTSPPDPKN